MKSLKYIGSSFLPGVPARDLTADEIKRSGYTRKQLIDSGLYKSIKKESKSNGDD